MTNKNLVKLISLFLTAVMVVPFVASCTKDEVKPGSDTTPQSTAPVLDPDDENADAVVERLYGDKKYDGEIFRIQCVEPGGSWLYMIGENASEVWFEDAGSDVLQRAVYERNRKTQNLLGIEIKPVYTGSVNDDVTAGIDEYDVALIPLGDSMVVAQNGNTLNFNNISTMDSSRDWWDNQFVKDCTLFGEDLYAIAGAINIMDDMATSVLIFNKDLLERNNCEIPYQKVFDGVWTVDVLAEIGRKCTVDLNGDTEFDDNDSWGFGTYGNDMVRYGLQGFAGNIATLNEDGIPTIVCNTEENIEKCRYWFDTITNSDCYYNQAINGDESFENMFLNGQLAFALTNLNHTCMLRDMDNQYGVLPLAKYNEQQERYTAGSNSAFFTTYVIPKTCKNPEMAGTCLEVMCGYSVNTVDESLHDIVFDSKLARDEESRRILKTIQDTVSFDWNEIGNWAFNINSCFSMPQGASFTLASNLASVIDSATESLDSMIQKFEALN